MPSEPELKEWTVMFYLATDNPLASSVVSHLKAMKNAGYHPQVNVLAQFDPHGGNIGVHVFDVNNWEKRMFPDRVNIGFGPNDSYVRNLVLDKLWNAKGNKQLKAAAPKQVDFEAPIPWPSMTRENNPEPSLRNFLNFCREKYPARHYMLFVLGHGLIVAGDAFLYDENGSRRNGESGPRSLSLKQLGRVLKGFNEKIQGEGELELISFHSCSMSGAEVAFELKDQANYMLAAQGPAYVGVWPYRQILIRLFNDLGRSAFSRDDLETNGLIDDLKGGKELTYRIICDQLNGNGAKKRLEDHVAGTPAAARLVGDVTSHVGRLLSNPELFKRFRRIEQPEGIKKLIETHTIDPINGEYLKWLNRQLLMGGLPEEARARYTKANIKTLLISIFKYCYFNSLDFQLAGYSCDLTLCNLRKVHEIQEPVQELVTAMGKSLDTAPEKNQRLRDLLVLAHWESQSFYEEKYTDLYDFCFCLERRCQQAKRSDQISGLLEKIRDLAKRSNGLAKPLEEILAGQANPRDAISRRLDEIIAACNRVMDTLKRGSEKDDDGVIVRSESCGPAYQYARGLSVYFPWSEPTDNETWRDQYKKFKFSRATGWRSFLKNYFDKTMRDPQEDENDKRDPCLLPQVPQDIDRALLDFLEDISTAAVYNDEGQLKVGSRDPLGPPVKVGSLDPMGNDCDCGSIKNYPTISHSKNGNPFKVFKSHRATINNYASWQKTTGRQR